MKISYLRQAALLGLAAAALLGGRSAFAQGQGLTGLNYQVSNYTLSAGDALESVTDDLTFNNLVITETFGDGSTTALPLGSLTTGDPAAETPATLFDPTHGALTSVVLTGTLGIDGFPASSFLDVTLQTALGGATTDQRISTAFSTPLSFNTTNTAPAGSISVGQFALLGNNFPLFGAAPTEIIVTPVPEASTVVSMGVMLALGLGLLAVSRRRRTVNAE
jgi:MYXO-CTERM domain-containing protein